MPGSSIDGVFRQEYWTGLPLPPPEDLSDPGIKPTSPSSPALQADPLPLSHRASLYVDNRQEGQMTKPHIPYKQCDHKDQGRSHLIASHHGILCSGPPSRIRSFQRKLKEDAIWQARDCCNGCWVIVRVQVERAGTSGFHRNQTCSKLHVGPCGQPFPHITRGFGAVSVTNSPPPSHITSASSGRRGRSVG